MSLKTVQVEEILKAKVSEARMQSKLADIVSELHSVFSSLYCDQYTVRHAPIDIASRRM